MDISKDAPESFVFQVEQIYNNSKLDTFQLGFIVSHDDSSYCKIWKEFSIGQSMIYFDYKEEEGVDEDTDINRNVVAHNGKVKASQIITIKLILAIDTLMYLFELLD